MSDDVIELQFRIAHLEETITTLTEASLRQETHIRTLQKQVEYLAKQLKGSSAISGDDDQPPPHY